MASKSDSVSGDSGSGSGSPPETPVANRTANSHPALVTPPNRTAAPVPASLLSSSIRRVHFSPSNEEIHSQTAPHSSPTRARLRPYSRSILKRSSALFADGDQHQLSSDADYGDQRDDGRALSSTNSGRTMLEPAARVLFGGTSAFPQVAANSEAAQTFEEAFPAAVKRLHELVLESEAASALGAIIYNKLCGLSAKFPAKLADHLADTQRLLECMERDLADEAVSRQVVLVAIKCLGCVLHIANVCSAVPAARVGGLLAAMHRRIAAHFKADKAVCQAGVWCVSMLRAPPASFQPLIPDLAKLCARVLATFTTSTSVQFECLAALETLLRRAPVAMRDVFHLWLLPVFFCIVNPVQSIRANADSIIRQNIPWIAADLHGPDMDLRALQFLEAKFDRFLELSGHLFDRGEPVLLSRAWGMYVTIFAKHCRTRLNDMLKVVQQCFNSTDSQVLVAALMQWRCLIYAFYLSKQLQRKKCIDLILTPITSLLKTEQQPVEVRLACVRCWATLVYALGDEIGSNIGVIAGIPKLLEGEPDLAVREIVARVLAALLNRFVLSGDKVPQFVIPQMIIGTTTLAASDGKGLSTTHGPFSSETDYGGDHTEIMCRYIVGLSTTSPTLPVILRAMSQFIKSGLDVCHLPNSLERRLDQNNPVRESDFKSYGELCDRVALALSVIEALPTASNADAGACKHGERRIPEATRLLVFAYLHAMPPMLSSSSPSAYEQFAIAAVPRSMLYQALTRRLGGILGQYCMSDEPQFAQTFATTAWSPSDRKAINGSSTPSKPGLADIQADKVCCELALSVCRSKYQPDNLDLCPYDLPKPTYLGVVRSYGFNDMVDHPLLGPVGDTEPSALCFQPAAPESGSASSHDLGDCAALLCAISYGRKHSRRDSLHLQRSQVEYIARALEWVATWIPLFGDRTRADLSAVVVREFVYLFYHTPVELQETLRQSSVPDSAAWNSGQFWRSTYIAAYDLLSRDALRLSSDHMRTLVHLSARGWNLQDDMVGTVFRHMTAHLLLYCAVASCVPDLSLGRSWSWRDVLPDQFLLGDTKSSALHAYSACARMLQDLPEFPDSLREEDLGDREWLQTAVKLCLKTLFSIGDGDAEHAGETVAGNYLDAYDIASDIPRRDNYAGLVDKSTGLAELAMRLLERLAGRGDGVGGDSEPSTDILNDQEIAEEEDICASAMPQPIAVQQATVCPSESELCSTPRGKKRKTSKSRRSSKRRKSATGDSSREGTRETTPETPPRLPPPLPPASAPEQLRRLIQEIETVVDASGSSLQPADICHVQAALANMQLRLCHKLREKL